MPDAPSPPNPFAGIERDPVAIERAMLELAGAIVASGGSVFHLFNEWPEGKPQTEMGQFIARPITTSLRSGWVTLRAHLAGLVGEPAAKAAEDRIAAVVYEQTVGPVIHANAVMQ